jgi:hypothetical protein
MGLPFPEIFLMYSPRDTTSPISTFEVVDGQQRLATIHQYITGSPNFKVKGIKGFQELTPEEKYNFLDYHVVVRELRTSDENEIFEVFLRINSVNYALNAVELTNALYEGEFITTARQIAQNDFFTKMEIFSENEFSRKKDLEFVLLIMSTIEEGGYFAGSKEMEIYVQVNDAEYPNKYRMLEETTEVLRLISQCHLPPDSLWFKRANLFTLIVELMKLVRERRGLFSPSVLESALFEFESQLQDNKARDREFNEYATYYHYLYQGTNSRGARYTRGMIFRAFLDQRF